MTAGCKVKIDDIGPLATVVRSGKRMVKLELEGEQFWMPKRLVKVFGKGAVQDGCRRRITV